MTNFDKLIKERKDLVIKLLSEGLCFDSDGNPIETKLYNRCEFCKFGNTKDCEEEVKKWLNEEEKGDINNENY